MHVEAAHIHQQRRILSWTSSAAAGAGGRRVCAAQCTQSLALQTWHLCLILHAGHMRAAHMHTSSAQHLCSSDKHSPGLQRVHSCRRDTAPYQAGLLLSGGTQSTLCIRALHSRKLCSCLGRRWCRLGTPARTKQGQHRQRIAF